MMENQIRSILGLLLKFPTTEFSYREIERRTGISIGTVSKYAKILCKRNLITLRKLPNSYFVKANINSKRVRSHKIIFNLEAIYESGLLDFLNQSLRPDSIVLFGSYSKGEDNEESDIDFAVIAGRDSKIDLFKFEKILARKINLVRLQVLSKAKKEFVNSLANGIVLGGYLEVMK
jgi:predicted nucleotidyltransferase